LTITKYLDSASPILFLHVATGKVVPEALLTVRKAGGKPLEYVKLKMKDAIISSVQTGGSVATTVTEAVGINFAEVEYGYVPRGEGRRPGILKYNIIRR
jgi:type VI secretion system secreted protein Hcp